MENEMETLGPSIRGIWGYYPKNGESDGKEHGRFSDTGLIGCNCHGSPSVTLLELRYNVPPRTYFLTLNPKP